MNKALHYVYQCIHFVKYDNLLHLYDIDKFILQQPFYVQ